MRHGRKHGVGAAIERGTMGEQTIVAETLAEALRELAAQTPDGQVVLSLTQETSGASATARGTALTTEQAYAEADALVPSGASITERRVVRPIQERTLNMEAETESEARRIALAQSYKGAVVRSVVQVQAGRSGILGMGRRLARWRVTVNEPAVVEISHRSPVRITARMGPTPHNWDELATALRAIAEAGSAQSRPATRRLMSTWPYQVSFMLLSGWVANKSLRWPDPLQI